MNETDVKELFASVAANPAADTIDMDAVLRGGRRRHRTRVAATLGASLGALAVVGVLLTGVLPGNAPTPVGPNPASTATASTAPGLVTSADEVLGLWDLTEFPRPGMGKSALVASTMAFGPEGVWMASGGGCFPPRGTFTITPDGAFTAVEKKPNQATCAKNRPDITRAVQLTVQDVALGERRLTMLTEAGEVLAVWTSNNAIVDPANWAACTKLAKALVDAGIDVWGFGPNRGFTGIELMGPELSVDPDVQARARQIAQEVIGDKYTISFIPNEQPGLF